MSEDIRKDQRLIDTEFFVEANSFEKQSLWNKHSIKTGIGGITPTKIDGNGNLPWITDSSGFGICVGYIKDDKNFPVMLSFSFAKINHITVCFYEATSRYVDYTMIEDYIREHFPRKYDNDTRSAMTDANNFHNCLHYCIEEGEKRRIAIERKEKIKKVLE